MADQDQKRLIRAGAQRQLLEELDRTIFTRHSFRVAFNEGDDVIQITYGDRPEWRFLIRTVRGQWHTIECPGETFTTREKYPQREYSQCRARLRPWLDRLVEEIALKPPASGGDLDAFRRRIDQAADSLDDPEQPFGADEAQHWQEQLDALVQRIGDMEDETGVLKAESAKLRADVDRLKSTIETIPRKTWFKAAGYRVLSTLQRIINSRAGTALLVEASKYLLKEAVED